MAAKKRSPKQGKAKSRKPRRRPSALKPGKKPLSPDERTERLTVNLPASMYSDLLKKAAKKSVSAYLRELVAEDLKKAS